MRFLILLKDYYIGHNFIDPENAIAFSYKRNLWPNTASKLTVLILTYLKQYAPFCPASFSLSLAQILRLTRKIKFKCIFLIYLTNPPGLMPPTFDIICLNSSGSELLPTASSRDISLL